MEEGLASDFQPEVYHGPDERSHDHPHHGESAAVIGSVKYSADRSNQSDSKSPTKFLDSELFVCYSVMCLYVFICGVHTYISTLFVWSIDIVRKEIKVFKRCLMEESKGKSSYLHIFLQFCGVIV